MSGCAQRAITQAYTHTICGHLHVIYLALSVFTLQHTQALHTLSNWLRKVRNFTHPVCDFEHKLQGPTRCGSATESLEEWERS